MRYKNISVFVFIGSFAIIILQLLWLYNTYVALEDNLYKESNTILIKAIRREISIRFKSAPKGTEIVGVSIPANAQKNELAPEIVSLNEGLSNIGLEISLSKIDSIASNMLNDIDLPCSISINKIRISDNKVLSSSNPKPKIFLFGKIKSKIINITADSSQGVQLEIINPYMFLLGKMSLLIIITIIVLSFIIGCIIYQIKIISKLQVILQIREDFSYAMVHDMKTPLSSILSALNFLQGGRLDNKPEMKERFFSIAKDEADHLLTLTNKILTISKLENHKLEMNCEMVMLEPLLLKLSEKFKVKSPKPVTFEFDLNSKSIYADAEYIEEVFSNLIDNSIKYSKDSVDIRISSSDNSKYSIIKFYDNGLGINEDDQLKIFNKYERAYAGRRNKGQAAGFGLGLNFVQQVIEAHKGKIFVNSIEGEFTEFIIYLPLIAKDL
mgnify:FL=1|jgi:signal transduction histidine kinase